MFYCFDDYTLDEARRELRRAGQLVTVEPKVFHVLLYLLEHRDRVVSKQELLEQCWPATFVSEAALTRCLTKLRKGASVLDGTRCASITYRDGLTTLPWHGQRVDLR